MSKSGLYAHFGSKEDLQLSILELAVERFVDSIVRPAMAEPRGMPRIRAIFEGWMRWETGATLPGGCVFVALANELDDRPGPLRDRLVDYQSQWLGVLARAARIAQEEEHFRADLDPEQFAYELYAVFLAYHHFHRLLKDPGAKSRAENAFAGLLRGAGAPA